MCFLDNIELEDTTSNKEYNCDASEPPCKRDTYGEA